MNIYSAIHFGLSALSIGGMICSIAVGNSAWVVSLTASAFCFCNGIASLD